MIVRAATISLLGLAACTLDGSAQVISGVLLDAETSNPIPAGEVALVDEAMRPIRSVMADLRGRFEMRYSGDAPVMVYATALAYRSYLDGPFDVADGDTLFLEFRIDPQPIEVDEMVVSVDARQRRLETAGFYQRQRSTTGGVFLDFEDIDAKPATRASDLFAQVAGVRLQSVGGGLGRMRVTLRNGCTPTVFVDGVRARGGRMSRGVLIDEMVRPEDIEGIEIYRSSSQVPIEFDDTSSRCGAILLWTR